jgi:hypothetical protein
VLAALGARIRFRLAADVTLATFFVSHLTPFGSATGTLVNASTLEAEGVPAATTGEAIALTSLMSTIALIVLFGTGFAATAGRHVSRQYLMIAGIALVSVVSVLAAVLVVGAHPAVAGRAGRWAAAVARHVRPGIDPAKVGETSSRLASLARTALTGRAAAVSFGFASGDLLYRGHPGGRHRRLRRAPRHGGAGRDRLPDRELLAPAHPRRDRLHPAPAAPGRRRQDKASVQAAGRTGQIASASLPY